MTKNQSLRVYPLSFVSNSRLVLVEAKEVARYSDSAVVMAVKVVQGLINFSGKAKDLPLATATPKENQVKTQINPGISSQISVSSVVLLSNGLTVRRAESNQVRDLPRAEKLLNRLKDSIRFDTEEALDSAGLITSDRAKQYFV